MCERSTKLISWMDRELASDEAFGMDQHVAACGECRKLAGRYQEASSAFALYAGSVCVQASKPANKPVRRRPAMLLLASGLAAALIALLLVGPRHSMDGPARVDVLKPKPSTVLTPRAPAMALQPPRSRSIAMASRPRAVRRIPAPAHTWMPAQPSIQIAIPSDALFPPGAVPEGFAFAADLILAADGSPAELALRP